MLSIATSSHWPIRQLDISNVFLHGFIDSDIYMEQPIGFQDSAHPDYVCKLSKSLYGLKQAPRAWFHRLTSFLQDLGFQASKADSSLFILHQGALKFYVLIYVDNILLTCSNSTKLDWFLSKIKSTFPVRDLGSLHFFLGIEAQFLADGLLITQRKYITDLLANFNMSNCKPYYTPLSTSPPLSKLSGDPLSNAEQYRQVVGSL
ncbi:hypothetical protein PVL29_004543 [Vitis rotundifolia]|uniref:Reverse transcriptase Ty1/copia-type domain-containing protein n=1 Tax=Vitis rotundifolia TaxID=103349 RepID=A0AA39A8V2_VITRO|nr:hypothetical protein PVL29_004543 [Vitis rotundifolia]